MGAEEIFSFLGNKAMLFSLPKMPNAAMVGWVMSEAMTHQDRGEIVVGAHFAYPPPYFPSER